jgi:hypothetical protein
MPAGKMYTDAAPGGVFHAAHPAWNWGPGRSSTPQEGKNHLLTVTGKIWIVKGKFSGEISRFAE